MKKYHNYQDFAFNYLKNFLKHKSNLNHITGKRSKFYQNSDSGIKKQKIYDSFKRNSKLKSNQKLIKFMKFLKF
jgi:hypothetical protein